MLLRVKSDSISALVLSLDLKTSGFGAGIIAREIALDVAATEYKPDVAEHVPGLDNDVADMLSRKFAPTKDYVLPSILASIPEAPVTDRHDEYYRTVHQPPAASKQRQRGNKWATGVNQSS